MTQRTEREVLLEFHRIGSYMKATAVDPETRIEVSVVGPATGSREMLKRTALAKLNMMIGRQAGRPAR